MYADFVEHTWTRGRCLAKKEPPLKKNNVFSNRRKTMFFFIIYIKSFKNKIRNVKIVRLRNHKRERIITCVWILYRSIVANST